MILMRLFILYFAGVVLLRVGGRTQRLGLKITGICGLAEILFMQIKPFLQEINHVN